ncbi:branched-chain amino acid ABC transporter permease [Geothermobacter hydrogeniphilus]|uniref:Branched-chain amino acid ABC transporter permease n=1 Tax=Geothermobacter hydrogeniphilus TaxID=1969733 RepID=A0A2K2H6G7_9BACT|nr:AzlC family ABC transporter permease [Geothermobacter hydrogeniphilus]PNU18837.1 branched-chain amino acid ABC transporter permease [Geothermobacter hydrogeniphilus]
MTSTQYNQTHEGRSGVLRDGLNAAWPICLGYFPIGMALGVLGQQAGLGPAWIGLMSVLVFAGSAQFIAVAMLDGGASATAIILTTLVVNFRHFLMSSALAIPLRGVRRGFLILFAYGITDESFGVNMTRFRAGNWDRWRALVVHHAANSTWILATILGSLVGSLIPPGAFGIDFALPGMFIALLVLQLHGRAYVFTGILAAGLAVIWKLLIPGDSYIVGAAILAATGGYLVRRRVRRQREAKG